MDPRTFTIRGAEAIDGTGAKATRSDMIVKDGVISKFGTVLRGEEEGRVIDASGLTLTPGFIDLHAHSDLAVISDMEHLSKVTQGVTLEVVGQDGLSYVPSTEETLHDLRQQLFGWNGEPAGVKWNFHSVADYLSIVDKGAAVNVAYLVPHGSVRMVARGNGAGLASPAELERMKSLVAQGMEEGAVGLSNGLTYTPAMYADDAEIIELCKVVAKYGGYYAPHHRNYGEGFLDAVDDCIEISRASGSPLHLTHCHMSAAKFHDRTDLLFDRIDKAEHDGLDISLDSYPYLAGSTYLHAMLPSWLQDGGSEGARIRLSDSAQRAKAIHELTVTGSDGAHGGTVNLEVVRVAGVERPENLKYVGQYVAEIARAEGKNPIDFYLDLILAEDFRASCIIFAGHEGNVRAIMRHRRHMVGSDGILAGNKPHPRGYGTFARYLGHYSREEKVLTLEDTVAHMTGRPASRLSLKDRGVLKVGYKADLVLFDAQTVLDLATYDDPRRPAAGFESVWIDGLETLSDGKRTSHTPGRAIRSSRR
ncbi:MAG: D-aminoacylase [Actinobacteria bacterium]|nr:D-aminoacylase [Actinomycetota bacterium]